AAAVEVEHRDSEIVVAGSAAVLLGHFISAPGVAGTDREPVEQRVLRVQPDAASLVVALAAGEAGYGVTAGDIVEPIERRQRVVRAEPEAVEKHVSTRELARLPGQVDRCGLAPGHHADRSALILAASGPCATGVHGSIGDQNHLVTSDLHGDPLALADVHRRHGKVERRAAGHPSDAGA